MASGLLENQEIRRRWEDESSKVIRDQIMISEEVDETEQRKDVGVRFDQECEEARLQKNLATVEWTNTRQQQKRKEYEIKRKECEEARLQKNLATVEWTNTRQQQKRKEYEIKRNIANIIYNNKKKKNDWINTKL
ncbi:hypothetical protein QE152_g33345 [Popillia japonica]|uniref:Uncharacterized protein n=1 Tax=Popillia japonica TaxID=7064 RepID=A0AAW1IWP5_POPJA